MWNGQVAATGGLVSVEAFHALEETGARENSDSNLRSPNLLIRGENSIVMSSLLEEFRGKIDLIYIDPPFDIGADVSAHISFGENSSSSSPKSDLFKAVAYGDSWEKADETYFEMIHKRLVMCREFLSERGSLYLHCDYRTTAYLRLLLEEVFGRKNYINECIWHYKTGGMPEKLGYGRKHDTIHFVAKDASKAIWHPQKEKSYLGHKYGFSNIDVLQDERGHYTMVQLRDVWTIPALRGNQPERVDYPTQKPEALLERIIRASSDERSLVADFFCGSGTTGVVAERLGRRWIMCDQGDLAIHTCRKRLLDLHTAIERSNTPPPPFSLLELRNDERKIWVRTRGGSEVSSYRKLVLELLKAESREEDGLFHGCLQGRPCHVSGIDQVVSAADIKALGEFAMQKDAPEVWCVAWSFSEDIAHLSRSLEDGPLIRLVQIPREVHQQGRKSAPQFFELPRFSFEVEHQLDDTYDVRLLEYIPARVLGNGGEGPLSGRRNEDYIDLWAVDFDFKEPSHFHYDWFDFRSRRKRKIDTSSSAHWKYPAPGTYTVAVKVVDVSGLESRAVKSVTVEEMK